MEITKGYVKIDSKALEKAVKDSPFSYANIVRYLGRGGTFMTDAIQRGTMNRNDLSKISELINADMNRFILKEPEEKKEKPLTAKNDATQNWMINVYRAIEDTNDMIKNAEVTEAIRGVRQAITEQTAVMKEMVQLLGDIKLATDALKASELYANQERKKQVEQIYNLMKYGRKE